MKKFILTTVFFAMIAATQAAGPQTTVEKAQRFRQQTLNTLDTVIKATPANRQLFIRGKEVKIMPQGHGEQLRRLGSGMYGIAIIDPADGYKKLMVEKASE